MLSKNMTAKAAAFQVMKDEFEQHIMDEIVKVATQMNLDEAAFLHYGNMYTRGHYEVPSKRLDALDDLYCDNIHSGGFQGIWQKEKGWS